MGRLRLRTFIALPLEDAVRRRIVKLQTQLAEDDPDVKWVEPENLHVTLLFLGEIDAREVVDICRAVRSVAEATAPIPIGLAGIGGFPNLRRPRTLWVGIEEGRDSVIQLHAALEKSMSALGGFRREERDFAPHITLGRVKASDVSDPLRTRLGSELEWHGGRQVIREVHVMSSELLSAGPRYSIVSREKFRGEAIE